MKFHFSFQHEGTYATSSSTIRGVTNVPKRSKSAMQRLPPNMEVSSRNSPAPAGRKMVLVAHHGAGGEIAVNVLDPQRWRCHCILAPKPKAMVGARTIHTTHSTDGKSGTRLLSIEGEIGSGGNVGAVSSRNQTKFPCTVLINWVGQEQYRFSLSLVSKIQGYNV